MLLKLQRLCCLLLAEALASALHSTSVKFKRGLHGVYAYAAKLASRWTDAQAFKLKINAEMSFHSSICWLSTLDTVRDIFFAMSLPHVACTQSIYLTSRFHRPAEASKSRNASQPDPVRPQPKPAHPVKQEVPRDAHKQSSLQQLVRSNH